jgi:hypothetical protein
MHREGRWNMTHIVGTMFVIRVLWNTAFGKCSYLDPSSASILIQVLLGGFAGVAIVVKIFWYRIANVLGIRRGYGENVQDEDAS